MLAKYVVRDCHIVAMVKIERLEAPASVMSGSGTANSDIARLPAAVMFGVVTRPAYGNERRAGVYEMLTERRVCARTAQARASDTRRNIFSMSMVSTKSVGEQARYVQATHDTHVQAATATPIAASI